MTPHSLTHSAGCLTMGVHSHVYLIVSISAAIGFFNSDCVCACVRVCSECVPLALAGGGGYCLLITNK